MSSLRMEVRMDLRDVVLVIENDKGTEINMLMSLDDYKKFAVSYTHLTLPTIA